MPRIPIVNKNDEIIKYVEDKRDIKDIYRVSALWLTNSKGEVLLAQRALNKSHDPGKWGPAVSGTVEEGETYFENIIKETEEEIGLTNLKFEEGPKVRTNGEYNYFCKWFLAACDKPAEDFKIAKDEVQKVMWISKENLLKELETTPDKFLKDLSSTVTLLT